MVRRSGIEVFAGGEDVELRPSIWVHEKNGQYAPLHQHDAISGHVGTGCDKMEDDLRYTDKEEIFEKLKDHVARPKERRLRAKVIGYMSKVISTEDRAASIWKKEAMALIHGLGKFKPLLEVCLLYTSPSPRDRQKSRMPSSA